MSSQVSVGVGRADMRTSSSQEEKSSSADANTSPIKPDTKAKAGFTSKLPDWISANLTSPRSLKVFLRCWLVSWGCLVLLLPQSSLETLGQAAFLGMIASFIIPPAMPLWLYVMASGTQLFGVLLGWAYGSAAMAASLRARDQVLLQQQQEKALSSGGGNTNPEALYMTAIFRGDFLDVRSTTVFGVFLCVAAWGIGITQIKYPKLKVGTIFLLIILDIMCSYGPLFPFGEYTLGEIVLIPLACASAIALAGEFLIFPETLNTAWQLNLIKMLGMARKTIGVHQTALHRMMEEEPHLVEAELDRTIQGLHSGMIALATGMGAQRGFLQLEITYGRLSGKDLSQLYMEIRTMIVRIFGLNAFFHLLEKEAEAVTNVPQGPVSIHETHTLLRYRQHWNQSETDHNMTISSLLPILVEVSQGPLKAIDCCLETTSSWLAQSIQRKRSYNHQEWLDRMEKNRNELQDAICAFMEDDRLRLIKPYRDLFHSEEHLSPESQRLFRSTARPLFICLVFCANLSNFCDEVLRAHTHIIDLAKKREKNKIWFPTGLRKIGKLIRSKKTVTTTLDASPQYEEHEDDDDEEDEGSSLSTKVGKEDQKRPLPADAGRPERLDPDALAPTNDYYRFARMIANGYCFLSSPASIFGIRFAIVTFALWLPAVLPSSAYFNYQNRGLWALITAQTGMAVSGGEVIFSLANRLFATLAGLVVAMLFWYMSCGLAAHGNPYGLAAVMAFGLLPVVFFRIFAPPILILPSIMFGVTISLCIGYSYIDGNLAVLVNSGVGYSLAWKRALLVIIGTVATFIVTSLPRPPSTREKVRLGFASSTDGINRLYSVIVESWIVIETSNDRTEEPRQGGIGTDIGIAPLDIANTGPWQKDKYVALLSIHHRLLEAIAQMSGALYGLDLEWRRKMLHSTAILNPNTISDISMTLNLLANGLRTGTPLPHASTALLERTLLNQTRSRRVERAIEEKEGRSDDLFTLDTLCDPQFMKHTAGVMALVTFARQLDKLQAVVRELVGEIDLPGFDELKKHYDQRLLQAYDPGKEA